MLTNDSKSYYLKVYEENQTKNPHCPIDSRSRGRAEKALTKNGSQRAENP